MVTNFKIDMRPRKQQGAYHGVVLLRLTNKGLPGFKSEKGRKASAEKKGLRLLSCARNRKKRKAEERAIGSITIEYKIIRVTGKQVDSDRICGGAGKVVYDPE
jgi:hypothetical protein